MIGINAAQLHAVPDVMHRPRHTKVAAVRAAVAAGYVGTLMTTAAFAQELLTMPNPTEG